MTSLFLPLLSFPSPFFFLPQPGNDLAFSKARLPIRDGIRSCCGEARKTSPLFLFSLFPSRRSLLISLILDNQLSRMMKEIPGSMVFFFPSSPFPPFSFLPRRPLAD